MDQQRRRPSARLGLLREMMGDANEGEGAAESSEPGPQARRRALGSQIEAAIDAIAQQSAENLSALSGEPTPATTSSADNSSIASRRNPRRSFQRRRRGGSSSSTMSAPLPPASPPQSENTRPRVPGTLDNISRLFRSRASAGRTLPQSRYYEIEDDFGMIHDELDDEMRIHPGVVRSSPGMSFADDDDHSDDDMDCSDSPQPLAGSSSHMSLDDLSLRAHISDFKKFRGESMKRSREKFEALQERDISKTLTARGAVSILLYRGGKLDPLANDVWPNFRSSAKLPARYYRFKKDARYTAGMTLVKGKPATGTRPSKKTKKNAKPDVPVEEAPSVLSYIWPANRMPTELYEEISGYLNRDDIKSMRLVCKEFDRHVSQVLFKTVVVPFNSEIYGMLGQEQKPDLKGKKKVKIETLGLTWKDANGDDVYNGHGLDVFRGFGQHILRYGMSFEVNEDSLAKPPIKRMTQKHSTFWGKYDWPFVEYRRFDDVADLETAADETPRMKTAFSELSKVRELALSVDSGLGWLKGPDQSIRARIIQKPPAVFGTLKEIPDRRAHAQRELWNYIAACHQAAESDVKLATLYKIEGSRSLLDLVESDSVQDAQPEMPFMDPHIIHEAIPHDTAEVQVPSSFEDPEILDRFVQTPNSHGVGVLFSSPILPTDAGQLMSPIIPAHLTKAQKEWLLETEWAQRAFISSYMLSVIDNPATFRFIHTLNISRLSDRYLPMLHRNDFWDTLPNLTSVVLHVISGYRTVNKDEAGFVETPRISPSSCLDWYYDLLKNVIGRRVNIKRLSIGWVTGGEHAEGVLARNRLILPAPLLPADKCLSQDAAIIGSSILQFPYVEELTLKNCWITPPVVQTFVQQHDRLSLKSLVLNSVSLTAVLRDNGNGNFHPNHAQHFAGVFNAFALAHGAQGQQAQQHQQGHQGQVALLHLQHHIQHIQQQIQQLNGQAGPQQQQQLAMLQAQLQAGGAIQQQLAPVQQMQLQQIMQHHQQALLGHMPQPPAVPAAPVAPVAQAPPVTNPTATPKSVLKAPPREGSWVYLLDQISPGLNLGDFESEHSRADSERTTSLESIQFISCGYAKLPYVHYDQTAIEPVSPTPRNPIFTKKYVSLQPAMLSGKWPLLGEIVQEVDKNELMALNAGWYLETGWQDAEEASAPEFDGCLPGGTGRFTGFVRKSDRVVDAAQQ
ncbi:hypothetical protein BDV96DRAFT_641995 [Lophiotrema nucula]|uniref:F-box domain-containing protein n=1 Tax=Lophiotrema nucula TaxID=690887 RepID=A0A6A5ZMB6_9PLEO|nr:hypothetical protein BDV96DRAFT_641995 [Lophiotrema nucula]